METTHFRKTIIQIRKYKSQSLKTILFPQSNLSGQSPYLIGSINPSMGKKKIGRPKDSYMMHCLLISAFVVVSLYPRTEQLFFLTKQISFFFKSFKINDVHRDNDAPTCACLPQTGKMPLRCYIDIRPQLATGMKIFEKVSKILNF